MKAISNKPTAGDLLILKGLEEIKHMTQLILKQNEQLLEDLTEMRHWIAMQKFLVSPELEKAIKKVGKSAKAIDEKVPD
jgi:hypothetical protein